MIQAVSSVMIERVSTQPEPRQQSESDSQTAWADQVILGETLFFIFPTPVATHSALILSYSDTV
ncbi:hypothetical protein [Rhizobium sp. CCGE 510]|uniref:hypothetical protein n=1 Tax=Rhizobium sp. CCGE 510 TaxID=1132836 RepID=UPI00027B8C68|nr:hypothetical protein [Rhizobium sp. CCGE 510]EJT04586.1 hypothetical protein RCCGE510_13620 [Rhizobium sp. CCGE 510]